MDQRNTTNEEANIMATNITVKQIEADVVITLVNADMGMMQSHPLWECTMTKTELWQFVAQLSLTFAEECGGGYVTATIQDFRTEE